MPHIRYNSDCHISHPPTDTKLKCQSQQEHLLSFILLLCDILVTVVIVVIKQSMNLRRFVEIKIQYALNEFHILNKTHLFFISTDAVCVFDSQQ